jgi:hypothetical protein
LWYAREVIGNPDERGFTMTERRVILCILVSLLLCSRPAGAGAMPTPGHGEPDGRRLLRPASEVQYGGLVGAARAARDTTYLLGGPGRLDGKFQDAAGNPDWHGWTHVDLTDVGVGRWHVAEFHSPTGTPALWCGQESYPTACGDGYGNSWREDLVFAQAVDDAQAATVVRLQCVFNSDSEPGFDYLRF